MRPIRPGQPGYSPFVAPMAPMGTGVEPLQMPAPQPNSGGGMFGNADWKQALAAGLAGFSAGMGNPAGAATLQALHAQRMMKQRAEQESEQYQRQRQDGLADYQSKLEIESKFKGPDYDAFQRQLIESGVQPGSQEWTEAHKQKTSIALNPVVMTPYGPMPYSAVAGAQAAPSVKPGHVEDGFQFIGGNPSDKSNWRPVQGGPTQPASGGFPGPL